MQLATSPRTRAFALAAMTAVSAITAISASRPAMAQDIQVAAATTQECVQPTQAEIKNDVSGRKTAAFGVCVLQNSIAQDQASIARSRGMIEQNKREAERLNANTAQLKEQEQAALSETQCADNFKSAFAGGAIDRSKLATFLNGRKPSQIGACNLWKARAAYSL